MGAGLLVGVEVIRPSRGATVVQMVSVSCIFTSFNLRTVWSGMYGFWGRFTYFCSIVRKHIWDNTVFIYIIHTLMCCWIIHRLKSQRELIYGLNC